MASVWSGFATLADPRSGNAQRHKLLDIVTIALVGSIYGAESCVDFADFARDREPLFREFLELPGGLPSLDTFSRDDRHGRGHRHARRQDHDDPPLLSVLGCDGGGNLRRCGARGYWRIENCPHWVLDIGFDEDRARNRCDHGPENFAIRRKLTLNVLRSVRPEISSRRSRRAKHRTWLAERQSPPPGPRPPHPASNASCRPFWSGRPSAIRSGQTSKVSSQTEKARQPTQSRAAGKGGSLTVRSARGNPCVPNNIVITG